MSNFELQIEEIKKHLDCGKQNWLFGAGISYLSKIPLMFPLTDRVESLVNSSGHLKNISLYSCLKADLNSKAHIEHFLSHIGDLIALAERTKNKNAIINGSEFSIDELRGCYKSIISFIGNTVRFGYQKQPNELVGTVTDPIIEVEHHIKFVKALFANRSNVISRSKMRLFTTNYDTLLEDALGLEQYIVKDGFSGGLLGFWNPHVEFEEKNTDPRTCYIYKLHGSIDWCINADGRLIRTRYGTKYLPSPDNIMIYPQATKYVETQKDPFSYLFSGLRNALNSKDDHILVTCGYSFGDEHINAEIEGMLSSPSNKTIVIAFSEEAPDASNGTIVNPTIDRWLKNVSFGERVRVIGKKGVYHKSINVIPPDDGKDIYWWTFTGLTDFLLS
ncbi:SIR2 family protein [Dyadobacter sp. CY312]|uniref:SIR2 family protein n=1 Tax=Dyadobacter sp. CY312 TaxID=2907303 RepID=UPI001F3E4AA0|nr:SIR2 family protein [Dyadobacter sp. CY312]MCE7044660.1 SIR2 family protein [Dyadobacter sp. CY312]